MGANTEAAIYAGIKPDRIIIIAMAISGALAGLMAVNEVLGVQHRLLLEFVGGAGFVGIAVALMGRSHPVGIVLAAMLFGLLYQGGAELSFAKPVISRDMIVVIQGLVILFMGALEYAFRPSPCCHFHQGGGLSHGPVAAPEILASTIGFRCRSFSPVLPACGRKSPASSISALRARCWRRLLRQPLRLAISSPPGSGLLFAILVSLAFALVHGYASINQRGNQVVSGVAINMLAAGLAVVLGNTWFKEGGRTPALPVDARFMPIELPGRKGTCRRAASR